MCKEFEPKDSLVNKSWRIDKRSWIKFSGSTKQKRDDSRIMDYHSNTFGLFNWISGGALSLP